MDFHDRWEIYAHVSRELGIPPCEPDRPRLLAILIGAACPPRNPATMRGLF